MVVVKLKNLNDYILFYRYLSSTILAPKLRCNYFNQNFVYNLNL